MTRTGEGAKPRIWTTWTEIIACEDGPRHGFVIVCAVGLWGVALQYCSVREVATRQLAGSPFL